MLFWLLRSMSLYMQHFNGLIIMMSATFFEMVNKKIERETKLEIKMEREREALTSFEWIDLVMCYKRYVLLFLPPTLLHSFLGYFLSGSCYTSENISVTRNADLQCKPLCMFNIFLLPLHLE